ncbi:MAG: flagellar export protein FliJ [Buchnera aphidicola (Microlophium carnosum)]|uniref:Flagellar FliJ protein n=1 Tax=Buchnera aphidicola (Microlophium carnosum) TaxID=2708354 RepID=A0A6G9JSJ0_9GAMM|nr:MAG: flagellar export protein FliJ [Buchnera aphidicola (Microlophium carnosum)]
MTYKKFSFSLLEEIEKKKIDIELINLKQLYLQKEQNSKQLQLLIDYQKEYSKKIHDKMILGICIHQWENYNNFISMLQIIIQDNLNRIEKHKKIIEESLRTWSKNKIKLKVWQHFNIVNKKEILKIRKIQEDIINNNYIQLKFLKKGQ